MRTWTSLALLALLACSAAIRALPNCPHQCVCEDNNIMCSCDSTPFSKLVISSLGGAYISSLTIHSCATVFVTNNSFAGVVLSERLSFIGISRLTFEPHAFRNILQSPKQLVIDKCTLPVLLPNAFTGLSHMEHIWFRNTTVEKLSTNAFFHLTHVNYLYFRDVTLKHVEQRAFGKMYSIGHLFMGGEVKISTSERSLFASSSIEEMLIEGLTGQLDVAFLLGSDIRFTTIRDSTLRCDDDADHDTTLAQKPKSTAKRHNSLTFHNVSMNVLVLHMLAHFGEVTISNSSIRGVRPCQGPSVNYLRNDLVLTFVNTTLETVDSYAFSNISAHILNLTSCVIGKMNRFAAAGALFDRVHFGNTEVKTIDEQLLAEARIKNLEIVGGQVDHILPRAFTRAHIEEMLITASQVNILDNHAFIGSSIRSLKMTKTTVNNVRHEPFEDSQIESLQISNSALHGLPARYVFKGLTPSRLAVVNSTFDCDPDDCEVNAMLLRTSPHELLWTFENNKCRTATLDGNRRAAVCVQPSEFLQSGLSCRLSWTVADCVCTEATATLPKINASVLVVGDCEHLSIADSESSPTALYLFRISKCDVLKVPNTTKTIKMYHSNAVIHQGAMENNHFTSLSLSHTDVYKVAEGAVKNVIIEQMSVNYSTLFNWHAEAVTATRIERASIVHSQIGVVASLLRAVDHLRIQSSVIFSGDGLSTMRSVQLNNNTVLCCCGREGSCENDARMRRRCAIHFGAFSCNSAGESDEIMWQLIFVLFLCVLTQPMIR